MKKLLKSIILLFLLSFQIWPIEHPTKYEWLEIYLTHKILEVTDSWGIRMGHSVWIKHEYEGKVVDQITVILGPSNGEPVLTTEQENANRLIIEGIIKAVIQDYEWAKNYKIKVTIM